VNRMSLLRRPGTWLTQRTVRPTLIGILVPIFALSACVSATVRSTEDVKALAGTYQGSGVLSCCPPAFLSTNLVVHEDGSYEMTGAITAKGIIKAEGNHIKCGPFNLWVYDYGKQHVLQGAGLGTQAAFSQRR
jgi:hypothetical protein